MQAPEFTLTDYLAKIGERIPQILSRPEKIALTYDILDTEKTKQNKLLALKEKQRQMKVGEIWQFVLGNYRTFIDLKVGDKTGLDIVSYERKIVIELKNRTNTDNASSQKANLDKLAKYKLANPEYTCIYANINADTEEKTRETKTKTIVHNGLEIKHMVGKEFLKYMLGDDMDTIIDFVRKTIDNHTA